MKNSILFIALAILMSSCFSVEFIAPQPQGVEDMTAFPEEFIGVYLVSGDTITIKAHSFLTPDKSYNEEIALIEAQSDSNLHFSGDILYDDRVGPIPLRYTVEHDTVRYHHYTYEEFFLSDSVVLRKHKKYTVLNVRSNDEWEPYLVHRQKDGNLLVERIIDDDYEDGRDFSSDSLMTVIDKVCKEERTIDNGWTLNPSKSEFKKLVKKGVFRPVMVLERVD